MALRELPKRTRLRRWLARVLRVGLGPKETRSSDEISRQAHAEALGQLKGWH